MTRQEMIRTLEEAGKASYNGYDNHAAIKQVLEALKARTAWDALQEAMDAMGMKVITNGTEVKLVAKEQA